MTDVFETVRLQLLALGLPGVEAALIREDSLLIDDLGLDSLKFVDLTVGLEQALGIAEFPMQEWVDSRIEADLPMTVGALAATCREVLGAGADEARSASVMEA